MTPDQVNATAARRGQPGEFRVGWYAMNGEPYHVFGCRFWPQVSGYGSHGFETEEAAQAAGHPRAKCCRKLGGPA